jgi:hypothetical protein
MYHRASSAEPTSVRPSDRVRLRLRTRATADKASRARWTSPLFREALRDFHRERVRVRARDVRRRGHDDPVRLDEERTSCLTLQYKVICVYAFRRRHSTGGMPISFLNARLKAASDS